MSTRSNVEIAIIGTGFSGMGIAIALQKAGIKNFLLLEKSKDIGGTWRDNQYPGACCDVPSQLYSYSYALNPDWSRRFSPAKEIHDYQQGVMDRFGLREKTRSGFEVSAAEWDGKNWMLKSSSGEQLMARFVISAIGALHIPHKPDFDGLEQFSGKVMHSAEWDHDYDWTGKNVVVVGSAASAIQIIPQLAEAANRVTVMQRSANYFVPRKDRAIGGFERALFHKLPFTQKLVRWKQYAFNDLLFHANFMNRRSPAKWFVHHMIRRHLENSISDPDLKQQLTPDYQIGCKRVLLSDDYFPALQSENVQLLTGGISHFSANALVTVSGDEIHADLVVLATGFQTTRLFGDMTITGPQGRTMDEAWQDEIRAHRSVAITGFPNLFMMYGPNSNLGHSSIIIMIEAQAGYIARLLKYAYDNDKSHISVRPEAEEAWNQAIQRDLGKTVWSSGCKSWYKDERGHIFSLWPHSTTRFIREMRKAPVDEYDFS